jgi:alkylation response protein AidB-like acyl-CoA dehydrogenase
MKSPTGAFPLLPDGRSLEQADFAQTLRGVLGQSTPGAPSADSAVWKSLATELGVVGFFVPEDHGGTEVTLGDLAVLHEELGYHLRGAALTSHHLAASALSEAESRHDDLLRDLALGSIRGAALVPAPGDGAASLVVGETAESLVVSGEIAVFADAAGADVLIVAADHAGRASFYAVEATAATVTELDTLDLTRGAAHVLFDRAPAIPLEHSDFAVTVRRLRSLQSFLTAVEQSGGALRCLELAVDHAKTRYQFDRAIGSFQAIKHMCADSLARLERVRALTATIVEEGLGAADLLASASHLANEAYIRASQELIQILGGVGFTWEHEAHLHLRRAMSVTRLIGELPVTAARAGRQHDRGEYETRVRIWFEENARTTKSLAPIDRRMSDERIVRARAFHRLLADSGLAGVTWPSEHGGQGLGPAEAYFFTRASEGFDAYSDVATISHGIVGPLLIDFGTAAQQHQHLPPLLRLDDLWCQLFSEPGSGSDLAGVQTRATESGETYVINGQKVWTTNAHEAQFGLLLARTDTTVAKHRGLTMFILDMTAPGVDVRRIKQITGDHEFCEVFLDNVEIGRDQVLGEVGDGWKAALATLRYERLALGSGAYKEMADGNADKLTALAASRGVSDDTTVRAAIDDIRIQETALGAFGERIAREVAAGRDPGAAVSISKLLTATLAKSAAELGMRLAGTGAVAWNPHTGGTDELAYDYLYAPSATIAGGTDQIQRNIIGEQLLGLPREPRPEPPTTR